MSEQWEYQIRFNLSTEFAQAVNSNASDPDVQRLQDILDDHNAVIKNQFDAFAGFCEEAEASGETDSELYRWTKAIIEKPGKKEQYETRFTVYAEGGKQIYSKQTADSLEKALQPFVDKGLFTKLDKIDSNPDNNPQTPRKFRM